MAKILIIDEVTPLSGQADHYGSLYLTDYAPAARARGMTLEAAWRSAHTAGEQMLFVWSVPDLAGWWRMRLAGEADKTDWWTKSDRLTAARSRRFLIDDDG